MSICPKCGTGVRAGKAFCFNCGAAMNAPRQEAKETPPEFVDTVLEPPRTRVAQTPAPPSPATLRAVAPAEMARAERTSPVVKSVPARSGFFGRRTWIVVLLLLLLLVLGFVALVVFVD